MRCACGAGAASPLTATTSSPPPSVPGRSWATTTPRSGYRSRWPHSRPTAENENPTHARTHTRDGGRNGHGSGGPGTLEHSARGAAECLGSPPQSRVRSKRRVCGPKRCACQRKRRICRTRGCMASDQNGAARGDTRGSLLESAILLAANAAPSVPLHSSLPLHPSFPMHPSFPPQPPHSSIPGPARSKPQLPAESQRNARRTAQSQRNSAKCF